MISKVIITKVALSERAGHILISAAPYGATAGQQVSWAVWIWTWECKRQVTRAAGLQREEKAEVSCLAETSLNAGERYFHVCKGWCVCVCGDIVLLCCKLAKNGILWLKAVWKVIHRDRYLVEQHSFCENSFVKAIYWFPSALTPSSVSGPPGQIRVGLFMFLLGKHLCLGKEVRFGGQEHAGRSA